MLNDLLEAIVKLANRANAPTGIVRKRGEDYFVRNENGKIVTLEGEPPIANKTAFSVADIVSMCIVEDGGHRELVYSRRGVVSLRNGTDHRERDTLHLMPSPQMQAVAELQAKAQAMDQRALLWALRHTFRDCLGKAGNLVDSLRKMQWTASSTTDAAVFRGKQSYGSAIASEVKGIENVPEYVTLQIPMFAAYFRSVQDVEFILDPDEGTKTFKFLPVPGAIESAWAGAEDDLGAAIHANLRTQGAESVAVYFGEPE